MHQQFLSQATAQLQYLTSEELREVFNSEDKLDERINEILRSLENEKDEIIGENRSLAQSNLEVEPRIIEARSRINELTQEGKTLAESVQAKLQEIKSKSSSVSPDSMLNILKASAAESEEKSESIAEDFLGQNISLDEFLEQFKTSRMEMHLRKLKAEKMQELLRQGPNNGMPGMSAPSTYPGMGNFYGNPTPYPQMPSGFPMPMPPTYRSPY